MPLRFLTVVASAGIALFLPACGSRATTSPKVVAELDGKRLTIADVQAYLDANLPADGDEEPQAVEAEGAMEQDEVKSRLFDNFIDEEVLVLEARRQGIAVDDDEIEAWLRAGSDGSSEPSATSARRELARRALTVEKVRGKLIRDRVTVTPDEVDAYVSRHREAGAAGRRLALRSYKFSSEQEAARLRPHLVRRESERASEDGRDATLGAGSEPLEVELSTLPEVVRGAVAELPAGQVSEPVTIQGTVYLFRVDAWLDPLRDDEDRLRRRAEQELLRIRHEEASRRLIQDLEKGIALRIDTSILPFRYVPEGREPALPAGGD